MYRLEWWFLPGPLTVRPEIQINHARRLRREDSPYCEVVISVLGDRQQMNVNPYFFDEMEWRFLRLPAVPDQIEHHVAIRTFQRWSDWLRRSCSG